MKTLMICPGGLPVPAVRGGAVEILLTNILKINEIKCNDLTLLQPKNEFNGTLFKQTKFEYIHIPKFIKSIDKLLFNITNLLCFKKAGSFSKIVSSFYYSYKISQYLRNNSFDKIIVEQNLILLYFLRSKKLYKKYIKSVYFHAHNELHSTFGIKKILNNIKIISISNFLKSSILANKSLKINEKNVLILKNAIDEDFFNKTSYDYTLAKKFNIDKNDNVIVFVGRIDKEKGIDILLSSLLKLEKNFNFFDFKLLVVGAEFSGLNYRNSFSKKIRDLASHLSSRIIFTGFVDYNEIPKYYKLAKLVVLPSVWNEPAGLTMLEAVSSGCCLITTNSGGIPEYVKGRAILLEKNNLENELPKIIFDLLINPDLINQYKENNERLINKKSLEKYYNDFYEVIR